MGGFGRMGIRPGFNAGPGGPARYCRWIEGEPTRWAEWCGKKVKRGSSYCPEHHARCYVRERPRGGGVDKAAAGYGLVLWRSGLPTDGGRGGKEGA